MWNFIPFFLFFFSWGPGVGKALDKIEMLKLPLFTRSTKCLGTIRTSQNPLWYIPVVPKPLMHHFFCMNLASGGRVFVRGRISLFPQRHRGEPRSNFYSLYTNTCQEANLETTEPRSFPFIILAPTTFSSSFFLCWFCCLKLQPLFYTKGIGREQTR